MALVIDCPSCTRRLKVPDELVGTRVKCPTCGGLFEATTPSPAPPTPEPPPPPAPSVPAPSTQAPLPPPGEVKIKLSLDDDVPWRPPPEPPPVPELPHPPRADDDLQPCPYCGERIGKRARRCSYCDEELDQEGDDRPWERAGRYGVRRDWEPHRGTLVLVLGILSVVCGAMFICYLLPWIVGLPLGITAWVMGRRDMRKMAESIMDPDGRGTTQGGYICGIIGTILNSLMAVLCLAGAGFFGYMMYEEKQRKQQPFQPPPPKIQPAPPQKFRTPNLPLRVQDYLPARTCNS